VEFSKVPVMDAANTYMDLGCVPGGTNRNWKSYGNHVNSLTEKQRLIMADPQTSGGLLISVGEGSVHQLVETFKHHGIDSKHFIPIGRMKKGSHKKLEII
jgi:selenide,water dikinase